MADNNDNGGWDPNSNEANSGSMHTRPPWDPRSFDWDGYYLTAQAAESSMSGEDNAAPNRATSLCAHLNGPLDTSFIKSSTSAIPSEPIPLASLFPDIDCPNLREGRVPCQCTDSDRSLLERIQKFRPDLLSDLVLAPVCQIPGCHKSLELLKEYHQRHRVCEEHARADVVIMDDKQQRYCQQCGRYSTCTTLHSPSPSTPSLL